MSKSAVNEAIALVRAGERNAARKLLILLVQENPKNELAWLWLVETLSTDEQRIAALENCLKYNPQSIAARRGLQMLRNRQFRTGMLSSTFPTRPLIPPQGAPPPPASPGPEQTPEEPRKTESILPDQILQQSRIPTYIYRDNFTSADSGEAVKPEAAPPAEAAPLPAEEPSAAGEQALPSSERESWQPAIEPEPRPGEISPAGELEQSEAADSLTAAFSAGELPGQIFPLEFPPAQEAEPETPTEAVEPVPPGRSVEPVIRIEVSKSEPTERTQPIRIYREAEQSPQPAESVEPAVPMAESFPYPPMIEVSHAEELQQAEEPEPVELDESIFLASKSPEEAEIPADFFRPTPAEQPPELMRSLSAEEGGQESAPADVSGIQVSERLLDLQREMAQQPQPWQSPPGTALPEDQVPLEPDEEPEISVFERLSLLQQEVSAEEPADMSTAAAVEALESPQLEESQESMEIEAAAPVQELFTASEFDELDISGRLFGDTGESFEQTETLTEETQTGVAPDFAPSDFEEHHLPFETEPGGIEARTAEPDLVELEALQPLAEELTPPDQQAPIEVIAGISSQGEPVLIAEGSANEAALETAEDIERQVEEEEKPPSFVERVGELLRQDIDEAGTIEAMEKEYAARKKRARRERTILAVLVGLTAVLVILVIVSFFVRWRQVQAIAQATQAAATEIAKITPTLPLDAPLLSVAASSWVQMPSMFFRRSGHTVTLTDNGQVLVAGGIGAAQEEIYSPVQNAWRSIAALNQRRAFHQAVLLQDGQIMVIGGKDADGKTVSSAELYDPASDRWTLTKTPLFQHGEGATATRLLDGRVLVAGGISEVNKEKVYAGAEIFDPLSGTWMETGPMILPRAGHAAVLLRDGKVLVCGGENGNSLTSAELFDPATNSWNAIQEMMEARVWHTATLLFDGRVLVAGGGGNFGKVANSAELYDPGSSTWSATAAMRATRLRHIAVRLADGQVLVAGGNLDSKGEMVSNSAELFDPDHNTWTSVPLMLQARVDHAAVLLEDGRVMVTGGRDDQGDILNECEGFGPEEAFAVPFIEGSLLPTPTRLAPLQGPQPGSALLFAFPGPPELRIDPPYVPPAISPDGKILALEGAEGNLVLWDTHTGNVLHSLGSANYHKKVLFSPDSRLVISNTYGPVYIWDVKSGQRAFTFEVSDAQKARPLNDLLTPAIDPDGRFLALGFCFGVEVCEGTGDDEVRLWDLQTGKLAYTIPAASLAAFSPVGATIATARANAADEPIQLWILGSQEPRLTLPLQIDPAPLTVMSFSPDGSLLVANAGKENAVGLWSTRTGELIRELKGFPRPIDELLFSPEGKQVVAASHTGAAWVWDVRTGEKVFSLEQPDDGGYFATAIFTAEGKGFVARTAGEANDQIEIWDVRKGLKIQTIEGHPGAIKYLIFTPDGTRLVTMSVDWVARLWELKH